MQRERFGGAAGVAVDGGEVAAARERLGVVGAERRLGLAAGVFEQLDRPAEEAQAAIGPAQRHQEPYRALGPPLNPGPSSVFFFFFFFFIKKKSQARSPRASPPR